MDTYYVIDSRHGSRHLKRAVQAYTMQDAYHEAQIRWPDLCGSSAWFMSLDSPARIHVWATRIGLTA